MPQQIFRPKDVIGDQSISGYRSRTSLYKAIEEGRFPKPIKISERVIGWTGEMLEEHQERLRALSQKAA